MSETARDCLADESGGALIEYALVIALVSLVAIVALSGFGDALSESFAASSTSLEQTALSAK